MAAKRPVVAVFDIGKTNKKVFLFDEDYRIVWEETRSFDEITDDEGFPCENLELLSNWIRDSFIRFLHSDEFDLRAVNFSAYGASFVHLDKNGNPAAPLYNYLKTYPPDLQEQFFFRYGGEERLCVETSSPAMGFLNAGLQLYWLKHRKQTIFKNIRRSVPLPQYLSYLFTGRLYTEITYLGSHSLLWDFRLNDYHRWVRTERLHTRLAPFQSGEQVIRGVWEGKRVAIGAGLHDSSAAVIPYLFSFPGPFAIISTGTWCISLHPFNRELPDATELKKGCLAYLSYKGDPVKTAMLFAGNDHAVQVKRIADHFAVPTDFYRTTGYDPLLIDQLETMGRTSGADERPFKGGTDPSAFCARDLSSFRSPAAAYHRLLLDIVAQQAASTRQVLENAAVKQVFVDGGFCRNQVYMHLLARAFPEQEIFAASMAQATALGAALAIHDQWNSRPVPPSLIGLKKYR